MRIIASAFAAAALLVAAHGAQASQGDAYNYQPLDSFNATNTMAASSLTQTVSGLGVYSDAGNYGYANGIATGQVQGSTIQTTSGVVTQSSNTGIGSNIGVQNTFSVGSVSLSK